jgi:hypothetical protein
MNEVQSDWEERVTAAWATLDDREPREFRAKIDALASELPDGDPIAAFERACSFDSTGFSDRATPLYRDALSSGLTLLVTLQWGREFLLAEIGGRRLMGN